MPRYLNIVFQGGGVRGIAYAGVLESLPSDYLIQGVAGTSAGSIVAALLAIGKTPPYIKEILSGDELYALIEQEEQERFLRLNRAVADFSSVWKKSKGGDKKLSIFRLLSFLRSHKHLLVDLQTVWTDRGLHQSLKLRKWLDKILEGKTFSQISVADLRIIAADVSSQQYLIYSKAFHPGTPIAQAVHASTSIPIFFRPLCIEAVHLVDGGLLSNFPSFVFAQGRYPTIGFRLGDITAPGVIDSTFDYLKGLLLTMTEAHDKQRGDPPFFRSYQITTPSSIPSTKFNLSKADVAELYKTGQEVGKTVDWKKYSSETPIVTFYDPKPQETLHYSLEQVSKLLEKYSQKPSWVEELHNTANFTVQIDKSWTSVYEADFTLNVKGHKQLFVSHCKGHGLPNAHTGPMSLLDCKFDVEEIEHGGKARKLILIPAYNKEFEKGFLMVFTPPISEERARRIRTRFKILNEFQNTLALGQEDYVSYSVQQAAIIHKLKLTFTLEIDDDLPNIECHATFGSELKDLGPFKSKKNGRTYRKYSCEIEGGVNGTAQYKVLLRRSDKDSSESNE